MEMETGSKEEGVKSRANNGNRTGMNTQIWRERALGHGSSEPVKHYTVYAPKSGSHFIHEVNRILILTFPVFQAPIYVTEITASP